MILRELFLLDFSITQPPAHLIAYHYVTAGRLLLRVEGHTPVSVGPGEIILLPHNDEHVIGSGANLRPVNANFLIQPTPTGAHYSWGAVAR